MFNYLVGKIIFLVFLVFILLKNSETRAVIDSQPGLYNSSDHVVVLNVTNLNSTILHSNNTGYLVEFYSSWCGFCQNFAPKWKALANDVLEWNDIVKIAAVDCANDNNTPLCRDYEIMGYPTVRYFSSNDNTKGFDIEKGKTVDDIRHELVKQLLKDQQAGKGMTWPNLTPFRNDLEDAWHAAPESVQYYFFLFDEKDSTIGTEVILDTHKIKTIQIRSVRSDNTWLTTMHKIDGKFPTLMVMDKKNTQTKLDLPSPATRAEISKVIIKFLKDKGLESKKTITLTSTSSTIETSNSKQDKEIQKNHEKDVLYQADLEYALRYSLEHEIPLKSLIDGDKMEALKNYIKILSKYFPTKHGNSNYLPQIYNEIKNLPSITGKKFLALIKELEIKLSPVYTEEKKLIGCKGSKSQYRGYPCTLWTLFHTLTVNHAAEYEDVEVEGHQPIEVLSAIHGYIKYFFSCADCKEHFLSMADEHKLFDVEFADDAILWLWRAHNIVNVRLSNDESEDPEYPKIRYPPREHCIKCRHHDYSWNEDEILFYLKQKYGYSGINYNGITKLSANDDIFEAHAAGQTSSLHEEEHKNNTIPKKFNWNITDFDISIVILVYGISGSILIFGCLHFCVRRSGKRKTIINPLLGKI